MDIEAILLLTKNRSLFLVPCVCGLLNKLNNSSRSHELNTEMLPKKASLQTYARPNFAFLCKFGTERKLLNLQFLKRINLLELEN